VSVPPEMETNSTSPVIPEQNRCPAETFRTNGDGVPKRFQSIKHGYMRVEMFKHSTKGKTIADLHGSWPLKYRGTWQ
jgi:hypothetical protein